MHKNNITELNASKDSGEYKVEIIYNSGDYIKELKSGDLLKLYYFVFEKAYLKEKNAWELALII